MGVGCSVRHSPPPAGLLAAGSADGGRGTGPQDGQAKEREAAHAFLRQHRRWGFELVHTVPLGNAYVGQIAERLRQASLLPSAETNDAHILAEAAALSCSILLTSDEHLRGMDFLALSFELATFDLTAPIIATPREIVRKFFR